MSLEDNVDVTTNNQELMHTRSPVTKILNPTLDYAFHQSTQRN